jgi:hypothetical protein
LDQLAELLVEHERVAGAEVYRMVESHAAAQDLQARSHEAGLALL